MPFTSREVKSSLELVFHILLKDLKAMLSGRRGPAVAENRPPKATEIFPARSLFEVKMHSERFSAITIGTPEGGSLVAALGLTFAFAVDPSERGLDTYSTYGGGGSDGRSSTGRKPGARSEPELHGVE